jgi:hypothetical protein
MTWLSDASDCESDAEVAVTEEWEDDPVTDALFLVRSELKGLCLDDQILNLATPKSFSDHIQNPRHRDKNCCIVTQHHPGRVGHDCPDRQKWYRTWGKLVDSLYARYVGPAGVQHWQFVSAAHCLSSPVFLNRGL